MLAVLVVVLAIAGVYIDALGGPFLWDDRLLVLDAPLVEKSAALTEYLKNPFWMGAGAQPHDTSYYRPLVTMSFALDHRLHASNPGGYHLTNVVLHLGCALLVLALLRRAGLRDATAALLTCAWALLPRLAEAAAWISAERICSRRSSSLRRSSPGALDYPDGCWLRCCSAPRCSAKSRRWLCSRRSP